LDGTLLDTEELIIETFKAVLKKFKPDLKVTRDMELSFLGPTLTESFAKLLPEDQVQPAFDAYRTLNKELHPTYVKAMPGAKDLLEDLKAKGYTLGIVSSKKKDAVELGLSLTGLQSYFSVIIGYDEVKKFKPDPEGLLNACKALNAYHDDVIYVGDTDTDMIAADKAGMYSVAYITHPERKDALLATKPNAVITHLSELPPLLEQSISWTRTTT
jgi:HAD superfamily hydrolase (TIGR01549 family)